MVKKKSPRRNIVSPLLVSIFATIAIFAAASIFDLPSRFLSFEQERIPSDEAKRPAWNKVTSSGNQDAPVNTSSQPGELVLWPEYPSSSESGSVMDSGATSIKSASGDMTRDKVEKGETDNASDISCTLEYYPVCGADGRTYSNPCMANRAKTIVAHDGSCTKEISVERPAIEETTMINNSETIFDTGSYLYYQNANYSFYLPKYSYYSGYGSRDGATHTVAIGLTSTSVESFDVADVKVYFYRTAPANSPAGKEVSVANGTLYIDGDTTNPKVAKIIDTIIASAK